MYKNESATHPWREVRDNAAYQRSYKNVGRDIKIGKAWILLTIAIVAISTIAGGILAMRLPSLPLHAFFGNSTLNFTFDYKMIILSCCFVIVQCIFVYMGNKYMVRLLTLQMVSVAVIGIAGILYLLSMPDTRVLSFLLTIVLSPYFLCAGILTLSWRAKLYLAYMNGNI